MKNLQGGDVGAVQVVVRVAEHLAGFLRRRVWREWPVGNGVFAIRRRASRTVDAGRRGLHQFGHVIRLACPQQVQRTADVAVDIRLGVFHRCSHPGPRRQVDHRVEAFREETVDCSRVGDVHSVEAEPLPGIELGEPPLFKSDVVGVIQIVDAGNFRATIQQQLRHTTADEPGGSRNEIAGGHAFSIVHTRHSLS